MRRVTLVLDDADAALLLDVLRPATHAPPGADVVSREPGRLTDHAIFDARAARCRELFRAIERARQEAACD